ncbi:MAG: hypothetical protein GQ527_09555 [Bacteroidales bacterium]|nr:hypothetical protein [Bacteroidales bacterium]
METFNPDTNNFDLDVDREHPYTIFESTNKQEIIDKIEKWFVELPVTSDSRLLKKRGEVDEPSESYRKELLQSGISDVLIQNILAIGNQQIQDILLDHTRLNGKLVNI